MDAVGEIGRLTTAEDVGQYQEAKHREKNPSENFSKASTTFSSRTKREGAIRSCLEEALIEYFEWKDQQDKEQSKVCQWTLIHKFCAERLRPDDAIISFNYDCSLERVSLQQGRFAVKYVENLPNIPFLIPNKLGPVQNDKLEGEILLLKLHGSVGWQKFLKQPCVGIPSKHLKCLGANPTVQYPDGSNWKLATNRTMIVPTWFKTFAQDDLFSQMWKRALGAMQRASEIVVVGYSFPKTDVASWLLRQAGQREWICVNQPKGKEYALRYSFESWMDKEDRRQLGQNKTASEI